MDLLKVMLIDTEMYILEELKNIIPWEKYGFRIVAETTLSKSAIDLFKKYSPDIVISDIWMSGINGLELSKTFLSINNSTKIILLTSYDDFKFAKFAKSMGISSYILKSELNSKIILNELIKIKTKIEKSERIKEDSRLFLIRSFMEKSYDLVFGSEIKHLYDLNKNKIFSLLLLKIDLPYEIIKSIHRESINIKKTLTLNNLEKFKQILSMDFLPINRNYIVVVISLNRTYSEDKLFDIFSIIADELKKNFKKTFSQTASAIISLKCTRLNNIFKVYEQLKKVADYSIFIGREQTFFVERMKKPITNRQLNFDYKLNALRLAIKNFDLDNIKNTINSIFIRIENPYWNIKAFESVTSDLVYMLEMYKKSNGLKSITYEYKNGDFSIDIFYNIDSIRLWFIKQFIFIAEYAYTEFKMYNYSIKIQKTIKFIRKNYASSISVSDISKELNITINKVDEIFLEETGLNFLEYLTKYRIEKSKFLLKHTKFNLYEISNMVGFKPCQYFSIIFKKLEGTTPLEYRKKLLYEN
jgi:two-component system response regulator YesN